MDSHHTNMSEHCCNYNPSYFSVPYCNPDNEKYILHQDSHQKFCVLPDQLTSSFLLSKSP